MWACVSVRERGREGECERVETGTIMRPERASAVNGPKFREGEPGRGITEDGGISDR